MRDVMSSPRAKAAVRLALDEDLGNALRDVSGAWLDATSEALIAAVQPLHQLCNCGRLVTRGGKVRM